jgi:hypothetical protein
VNFTDPTGLDGEFTCNPQDPMCLLGSVTIDDGSVIGGSGPGLLDQFEVGIEDGSFAISTQNPQGLPPCNFNVNITGVSGQQLVDMQNEITRIFQSGNLNVVFGQPGQANGGSMNLAVVGEFTGNLGAALGTERNDRGLFGAMLVGSGSAQVNATHLLMATGGGMPLRPASFASYGTIYGRVGAHEVITHGFLRTALESYIPPDIRTAASPRHLVSKSGVRFNMSEATASALRSLCPP